MLGLLGEKLGMTHVYDENGNVVPVTVVKAGPCTVTQVKTTETDGYNAIQLGFGTPKPNRVNKPAKGHCEKHGVGLSSRFTEFRTENAADFKVGQTLTVACFEKGDYIKVRGTTKGRGFQGVMKRWGKHGGPASHGSTVHRRPGSIGMCAWPGRVFKNMKMPGHMGVEKCTTVNLEVVEIRQEENLLFVKGAIPGWNGGYVTMYNYTPGVESRDAWKPESKKETPEVAEEPKEQEVVEENVTE
jgi:large subunit ribosomal protein L3